MFSWIDWPVLTRQLLLVLVPVLVAKGWLPVYLADPLVELATYVFGTLVVGWVIWLGQRRARHPRHHARPPVGRCRSG